MVRVLVVDDEPDIVRMVAAIMKECGHEVDTASDGEQALERAAKNPPDVIVIDRMLPGMDGDEVCKELRQSQATREIPVVMMTASYLSLEDARRSSAVGPDGYVVKPFMRDVLVYNVERVLARRSSH